jgi:single-strand DNA-binding protein
MSADRNVVELVGTVAGDPKRRDLPGGDPVYQFDVRTFDNNVPVVADGHVWGIAHLAAGDRVEVHGTIRRRFFRVGGVTQSRTEVVADTLRRITPTKGESS